MTDTNEIKQEIRSGMSDLTVKLGAWIRFKEKTPDDGQTVLGFWSNPINTHPIDGRNFGVATFKNGIWHDPVDESDEYCTPTHWIPLPEAPNV